MKTCDLDRCIYDPGYRGDQGDCLGILPCPHQHIDNVRDSGVKEK